MKVIITEGAKNKLIKSLFKEEMCGWSDKVNAVKSFLDNNFLRATNSIMSDDGRPKLHDIVIWVDQFKQPKSYMNDTDLFYLLQDQFKDILPPDEEDDEENNNAKEKITDIFNQALKDAEKKTKNVSHKNRDNFLKQCIKDWYYNKISKNGSLTLYEGNMRPLGFGRNSEQRKAAERNALKNLEIGGRSNLKSGQIKYEDAVKNSAKKENIDMRLNNWDDISIEGLQIQDEVNRLLGNFSQKRSGYISKDGQKVKGIGQRNKYLLMSDYIDEENFNSPDLYRVVKSIYTTRAAFKWLIMCPKFSSIPNMNVFDYIQYELNLKNIMERNTRLERQRNGMATEKPTELFETKEQRNEILPFYGGILKNFVLPFNQSELKKEINSASSMNYELNVKIEEFLDSLGFEKTNLNPRNLVNNTNNQNSDINFDDF